MKYPWNLKKDRNTSKTYKMIEIPSKPKNDRNTPETYKMNNRNQKNYQNTPKT